MSNTSVIESASPEDVQKMSVLAPGVGTFSANAIKCFYDSGLFGEFPHKPEDFILVPTNGGVVPSVIGHGGWGVLAMETLVGGRVSDSLDPLVGLINKHKRRPFRIVAAVKMELHFCLMTRSGITMSEIEGVLAHPRALDACRNNVAALFKTTVETSSNGEAARLVAEDDRYHRWAALGPKSASEIYGLEILHTAFEDKRAVTTFFLFGPNYQEVYVGNYIGKNNRVLIICKLENAASTLLNAIQPFSLTGLNLIQIYSVGDGDGGYNFAIEVEVKEDQLGKFEVAMTMFKLNVLKYLSFGPFVVLQG